MDPIKIFGGVVAAHDEMSDPNSSRVPIVESIRVMTKKFVAGFNHRVLEEKLVEYSGSGMLIKFYENAGRIDPVTLCCRFGYLDLLKYIYENNSRYRAKINRSTEYAYQAYCNNQPEVLEWLLDTSTPNEWESENFIDRLLKVSIPEYSFKTLKIMEAAQLMEFDPFDYFITMDKEGKTDNLVYEDLINYFRKYDVTLKQLDYIFQAFGSQKVIELYIGFKRFSKMLFEQFEGRFNFDSILNEHSFPAMTYENVARELYNLKIDIPRYFSPTSVANMAYAHDIPEYIAISKPHLVEQCVIDHLFEHEKYELLENLGCPPPSNDILRHIHSFKRVELSVKYFFRPGFDKGAYLNRLTTKGFYDRFIAACTPEQREIVEKII